MPMGKVTSVSQAQMGNIKMYLKDTGSNGDFCGRGNGF